MYRYLIVILVTCLMVLFGCKTTPPEFSHLKQDKFIQVYFNHRQTGNYARSTLKEPTYVDPYRQIERQGDNLEAIIINEIESAQSTIELAVQELRLPQIALALAEKHRSGVQVRVILDNNYSYPLSELSKSKIKKLNQRDRNSYQEFFTLVDLDGDGSLSRSEIEMGDALVILKNAGIPMIDDTADGSKGSGLMHHKFMVIDRKIIITGSTNFTLSGIHGDFSNPNTKGNVNHILKINNSDLANLFTQEFNYMWGDGERGGVNSQFGLDKPWRSPKTITWENTSVTVQFSPTSTTQDWNLTTNGLIGKAINNATSSVDLALFVFSEQKIVDILEQKQQQGIKIRAIFDPSFAFRYYSEALDMLGVALMNRCEYEPNNNPWHNPLKNVGIPQLALGDKLHHKLAIIDNNTVITGSQNWSVIANNSNDEAVIVIDNSTVANHFQQEFSRLYNSASLGLTKSTQTKIKTQQKECN